MPLDLCTQGAHCISLCLGEDTTGALAGTISTVAGVEEGTISSLRDHQIPPLTASVAAAMGAEAAAGAGAAAVVAAAAVTNMDKEVGNLSRVKIMLCHELCLAMIHPFKVCLVAFYLVLS